MKIRDHAAQFLIYILHPSTEEGAHLRNELQSVGYQVELFTDEATCMLRYEKSLPHILIFFTQVLKTSLSDLVEKLMASNPDLRWIAATSSPQFEILVQYREYGCEDIVVEDAANLESRLRWSVDRTCEKIYVQLQNEQLHADLLKARQAIGTGPGLPPMTAAHPITETIKSYALTSTPEQALGIYLENCALPGIYLRYIDTTKSFIVQYVSLAADKAQGLGFQADIKNVVEFFDQVRMGQLPPVLQTLCDRNLNWKQVQAYVLDQGGSLEGLLVHPMGNENENSQLHDQFRVFELYLENRTLKERVQRNQFVDPQTDLFNSAYYNGKIKEEMERSRRLQKPLSLVKISIDDFIEIEQSLGENTRDHLVKSLAAKIKASGRVNDINCRTKTNEFTLILPHSSKKGALVRAERLRRALESQSMSEYGVKISLSSGISEFPTLCSSAETLEVTATQALHHIMDKGGNKIAVFKPPETHRPEFPVNEEEA
ncbi:MAG: GGDEF domain-containing protein [Bdellovibrionota bacterium]